MTELPRTFMSKIYISRSAKGNKKSWSCLKSNIHTGCLKLEWTFWNYLHPVVNWVVIRSVTPKVIIHNSRGGVLEQDTIEYVSLPIKKIHIYFFMKNKLHFSYIYFMQLFCADATTFLKKNCPWKHEKNALKSWS